MSNFKSGETVGRSDTPLAYEEAAKQVTVVGWACVKCGRFYGDQEQSARSCCYTYAHCPEEGCRNRRERHRIRCESCYAKWLAAHWKGLEQREWDGKSGLVAYDGDTFWFDEDSLIEYCLEHDVEPSDLRLIHCTPCVGRPFELSEHLIEFPFDREKVAEVEKAVNDLIAGAGVLCWYPDHKSRPTEEDIARLDAAYANTASESR